MTTLDLMRHAAIGTAAGLLFFPAVKWTMIGLALLTGAL